MNIDRAILLINNKKTTVEDVYAFLFGDIQDFQSKREAFYIQELKEQCEEEFLSIDENTSLRFAERITINIEKDTKKFVISYVDNAIDALLDAHNEKKIKLKNGIKNFLVLLTLLKENYLKTDS
jgi:hypothetical protein